jgi:hypothetical protein
VLPAPAMKTAHRATPASLYDKLERVVVPLFYHDRERFIPGEKSRVWNIQRRLD